MKKTHHDLLLKLVRLLSVVLMTLAFVAGWYLYYTDRVALRDFPGRDFIMIGLFVALFAICGKVYDAFSISINRISEMAYSQSLAVLIADSVLFVVIWLLTRGFPNALPMLGVFVVQCMAAIGWAFWANHWYFRTFDPKVTAIVYDNRVGFESLIREYGLDKKYDVQVAMAVEDCIRDLEQIRQMKTVFICGVHSRERNIILKYCIAHDIEVLVIPRVGDVLMSSARHIHMFHLPMLQIRRYNASLEYRAVKRTLDILISLIAIVLLSPIMLVVAAAIKAYDHGPVLYSQVRLTKDAKEFRIYKFRSMRTDAEKDGVARLSTGENDDRITPVGKVIRKLRIDELPQLFNILKGELSICGPRPERPEIAAQYEQEMPEFALRLQAKAGLTGYAQVYGKYNSTPYDKLQMDLMYIAHPSIVEDLKIMLATVKILFMPESTEGVEEGKITAG